MGSSCLGLAIKQPFLALGHTIKYSRFTTPQVSLNERSLEISKAFRKQIQVPGEPMEGSIGGTRGTQEDMSYKLLVCPYLNPKSM